MFETRYGWSPGCVIVPTEVADRHFQTEDICAELEELVAAFFVTLQPRLNAVKVAARRVYDRAAKIDGLDVRKPSALTFPAAFEAAWQMANYVKHCDEWEAALTPQQQRCFEALVQLGTASVAEGQRKLDRWVLVSAACALSEETTLARAVDVIVRRCKTSCDEIETAMQADFTRIATAVEAVRLENVPRLRIRANDTLRNDDDVP